MPDFKSLVLKLREYGFPEFGLSDLKVPHARLSNFRPQALGLPDLKLPDLKLPDLKLPDLKTPDLNLPELKLPDLEFSDLKTPSLNLPILDTLHSQPFTWVFVLSIFIIHSLTVWVSSRSGTIASLLFAACHSILIVDGYRFAVDEDWSLHGMRRFSQAVLHGVCFVAAAVDIIRRQRRKERDVVQRMPFCLRSLTG